MIEPKTLKRSRGGGLTKMGQGYSPEQIVRKLRRAEGKLAAGSAIPEVARELGISKAAFHRRRKRYGAMSSRGPMRLIELERALASRSW